MSLLSFLEDWTQKRLESGAKRTGKNVAIAMCWTFNLARKRNANSTTTHAWLCIKIMQSRPEWKQTGENQFRYKTGDTLVVKDNMKLLDVTFRVVHVELQEICGDMEYSKFWHLLKLALVEAEKYVKEKEQQWSS